MKEHFNNGHTTSELDHYYNTGYQQGYQKAKSEIDTDKISLSKLYELLDSTDLLGKGADVLSVLENISNHNGTFSYNGKVWDLTK